MIWERYVDAAGEFFDELAANSLDTDVSDGGGGGVFSPSEKCLKTKRPIKKRNGGKVLG